MQVNTIVEIIYLFIQHLFVNCSISVVTSAFIPTFNLTLNDTLVNKIKTLYIAEIELQLFKKNRTYFFIE